MFYILIAFRFDFALMSVTFSYFNELIILDGGSKAWFSYVGKIPDDRGFYCFPTVPDFAD